MLSPEHTVLLTLVLPAIGAVAIALANLIRH